MPVPFRIHELTRESIEDATAYWLYFDGEAWEPWRLVPDSPTVSPNGRALRLTLELEGDRFELALLQKESGLVAKFDDRDDPEEELPARVFESDGDVVVTFETDEERVFIVLELAR